MIRMKKLVVILVLSLFLPVLVQSQPLSIAFPDTTVLPGTIQIPVSLSGTALVGSFDLEFKYYNVIGGFLQITDVNPNLTGLFQVEHMIGDATDWVMIHWESPDFVQLSGNTLFTVEMDYWGGSTPLEWLDWTDSSCAFYGPAGIVPLTSFIPGSINQASGINEYKQHSYIQIFPNPVSGNTFTCTLNNIKGDALVTISDLTGRIILQKQINNLNDKPHSEEITLDVNNGIYLLRVQTDSHIVTERLVVE